MNIRVEHGHGRLTAPWPELRSSEGQKSPAKLGQGPAEARNMKQ